MKLPGIYVEIKGDYSHLQKEIKAAKALVTEQATGISNALNNALSPQQVKGQVDKLVMAFGTLNRASSTAGGAFAKIGVDLGELRRITGLTEAQFSKLQAQLLKTQTANAQESALKRLATACNLTEKEIRELGAQFGLTTAQINKVVSPVESAKASLLSLGGVAKTAMAYMSAQAVIGGIGSLIAIADKYTLLESKIRLVSKETDNLQATQDALYASANRVRAAYDSQADMYVRTARSMSDYNITQEQTIAYAEAITRSMVISGATIQEASSFAIQFSQAMQKGNLNDDEFKSVMENNGRAVKVLTDYLTEASGGIKVTTGDLRQMSTDGKITADVLYNAFSSSSGKLEKEFNSMTMTVGQAGVHFKNAFENLVDGANDSSGASNGLAKSIDNLAETIEINKPGILSLFTGIVEASGWATERLANMASSVKGMAAVAAGELSVSKFATMNPGDLKNWMADYEAGIAPVSAKLEEAAIKLKKLREANLPDESEMTATTREIESLSKELDGLKSKKDAAIALSGMVSGSMGTVAHITTSGDIKKQTEAIEKAYKEAYGVIGGASKEVYAALEKQYSTDRDEFIKVTGDKVTAQKVYDEKMKQLSFNSSSGGASNYNQANVKYLEYQKAFEEKRAAMAKAAAEVEMAQNSDYFEAGNKNLAEYLNDQIAIRKRAIDANIAAKENELANARAALGKLSANIDSKGNAQPEKDASARYEIMKKIEIAERNLIEARSKGSEEERSGLKEMDDALVEYQMRIAQASISIADMNGEWEKSLSLQQDLLQLQGQRDINNKDRTQLEFYKRQNEDLERMKTPLGAFSKGLEDQANQWKKLNLQMTDLARDTASAMQESFSDLFFDSMQGKLKSLGDYVNAFMTSVQRSIANMAAQQVSSGIVGIIGGIGGSLAGGGSTVSSNFTVDAVYAHALGNVFNSPSLSAYSNSIVSRPTFFAKGGNVMGEAGPEAILPLQRTSGGELGVKALVGSGGANVIVNVNAPAGSTVKQQQRNENGVNIIDVIIEQVEGQIWGNVARGNGVGPATLQSTYGLNRAAGSY